jgi:hypothetical protein
VFPHKNVIFVLLFPHKNVIFVLLFPHKIVITFVKEDFKSLNLKGLRCSMKPYIDQGWMENIPLYAVEAYFSRS